MIRAMKELKNRGKTIIIISHRPSTIAEADRILVIDQGKQVSSDRYRVFEEAMRNSEM